MTTTTWSTITAWPRAWRRRAEDRKWRKRFGGDYTASPVSAEGRVYFTNEAGTTLVIRAGT